MTALILSVLNFSTVFLQQFFTDLLIPVFAVSYWHPVSVVGRKLEEILRRKVCYKYLTLQHAVGIISPRS
jgi:accessory gene regulator protein AgrB